MDEANLRETVGRLLIEACGSKEVTTDGIDLIEDGMLDSFALISLLDSLEDIGIIIQPTRVDRDEFRTFEGILQLCRRSVSCSDL